MKHPKRLACFFLIASILTAGLIFWFSAQNGIQSQALSDGVTLRVAKIIRPGFERMKRREQLSYLEMLSAVIRKNAHFCEYMLLGFNLMCFFHFRDLKMSSRNCRLWAWGVATLYACTDELHQLFVNERSAQALDVQIDSAGSLAGTFVAALGLALLAQILDRKRADD